MTQDMSEIWSSIGWCAASFQFGWFVLYPIFKKRRDKRRVARLLEERLSSRPGSPDIWNRTLSDDEVKLLYDHPEWR